METNFRNFSFWARKAFMTKFRKLLSTVLIIATFCAGNTNVFAADINSITAEELYGNELLINEVSLTNADSSFVLKKMQNEVRLCENKLVSVSLSNNNDMIYNYSYTEDAYICFDNNIDIIFDSIYRSLVDNSISSSGMDKNACARFTVTTEYQITTINGFDYYKITGVSGGYSDPGTSGSYVGENVYVTSQYINVYQKGSTSDGRRVEQSRTYNITASNRAWTYTPLSSWKAVEDLPLYALVGTQYYFTLARGSSSWTSMLKNVILLNGG